MSRLPGRFTNLARNNRVWTLNSHRSQSHLRKPSLQTLLLCAALLASSAALGAAPDRQRLFNIEMIVFADDRPDNATSELWRNDQALRYPPELIELVSASDFDAAANTGRGSLLVNNLADPELVAAYRRMRNSRWLRPLFAGSWQQQLQATDTAPSLLVTGGKQFGRYHELSGSIKLSLDRYLHINSDLWLSAFQPTAAMLEMTTWPQLPLPFADNPEDSADGLPPFNPVVWRNNDWFNRNIYGRYSRTTMVNAAWLPGGQPYFGNAKLERDSSAEVRGKATYSRLRQATAGIEEASPWILQRTVRLAQHRKMRSNELHYLDHPMFGVLIKITRADDTTRQ